MRLAVGAGGPRRTETRAIARAVAFNRGPSAPHCPGASDEALETGYGIQVSVESPRESAYPLYENQEFLHTAASLVAIALERTRLAQRSAA